MGNGYPHAVFVVWKRPQVTQTSDIPAQNWKWGPDSIDRNHAASKDVLKSDADTLMLHLLVP
jgi:hypothetical protein